MFFSSKLAPAKAEETSTAVTVAAGTTTVAAAPAAASTTLALAATETPESKVMEILDEGLESYERSFALPAVSAENIAIAICSTGSATAELTKAVLYGQETAAVDPTLALSALNLLGSGVMQANAYRQRLARMQNAQKSLLRVVAANVVNCYYTNKDEEVPLPKPYTAVEMIAAMERNGHLVIELNVPDSKFALVYNSFCSWRTAKVFGFAALPAFMFGMVQAAEAMGYEMPQQGVFHAALGLGESIPYAKGFERLMEICGQHERNIYKLFRLVVENFYVKPRAIAMMPEDLTEPLCEFLTKERGSELRRAIEQARSERDLESSATASVRRVGRGSVASLLV